MSSQSRILECTWNKRFCKRPTNDLISQEHCERISTLTLRFLFWIRTMPWNASIALQIIIPLRNQSVHWISFQVSKNRKRSTCTLILEKCNDFTIRTTFLCLFYQDDFHESAILFKSKKLKVKVYRCFGKYPRYKSWLGLFSKHLDLGAL